MNRIKFKSFLNCKVWALLVGLGLTSCTNQQDPYFFLQPQLPIIQPFDLSQAGQKVALDFWVLPPKKNPRNPINYGVTFNHIAEDSDSERPNKFDLLDIPVKAQLYLVQGQNLKPVMFVGAAKPPRAASQPDTSFTQGSGVVFPSLHGTSGSFEGRFSDEYVLLHFRPTEYGQYRVILETQLDNPTIRNEDFKLRVDTVYFGK
jgi:hypothetical protein